MLHRESRESGGVPAFLAGHVLDERARLASSSGGLLTWTAAKLLDQDLVDAVACVGPRDGEDSLYSYRLVSTQAELDQTRGSRYYPVDLSEVVREIRVVAGRYAVVALPCAARALRSSMEFDSRLADRVRFILGVTCGQMKTRQFAACLSANAGASEPAEVSFREKRECDDAQDFLIKITSADGAVAAIPWRGLPGRLWTWRCFTQKSCEACTDMFASAADVSFMDAWLPQYQRDWRGSSLAIVRDPRVAAMFASGANGRELVVENVSAEDVQRSQHAALLDKYGPALAAGRIPLAEAPSVVQAALDARSSAYRVRWMLQSVFASVTNLLGRDDWTWSRLTAMRAVAGIVSLTDKLFWRLVGRRAA